MLKHLPVIFLLLVSLDLFSQKPADRINTSAINFSLLDKLFNEKLNALRKSQSLGLLGADPILKKAAQDQSDYMNAQDTITHSQPTPAKKTPTDRVAFYKGQHDGAGENCLYTFIGEPFTPKGKKQSVTLNTYEEVAEDMFQSWKNSPPHYKNMINAGYELQGIGFAYNPKNKRLYSAQVFALKPLPQYDYPPAMLPLLSEYNLKPYNESVCKIIKEENLNGIRIPNRLYVQDNKVYLNIQNPRKFKKAFQNGNDMLAIDIVFKDQFNCEKNNRLHKSPYYDGVMMKPVSFLELFKRNQGKSGRLVAYICDLPAELKGKDYQLNAILIKSGCFCTYTYPVRIESQSYDLINLEPFWDTIPAPLKSDTFNLVIKQKIQFDKSKTEISASSLEQTEKKLKVLGRFATSVKLNAYSSVEGEEAINEKIQERRAEVILEKLAPLFPASVKPEIVAKENWELFYEQIKLHYFRYLNQFDKPQIKAAIRDSLKDRLEEFLSAERYAEFEIRLEGSYHDTSDIQVLNIALMRALKQNNPELAHEIQSKMIYRYLAGKASIGDISGYDIPDDATATPYAVNLLAAKAINPADSYYYHTKLMLELFKKFKSNKRAQYNFCIYAINYWTMTNDTLLSPQRLFDLVNKCKTLAPESAVNSMLLNYHLAAVKYYTEINNYDQMSDNLYAIHDLFSKVKLDLNTSYKLALYFADYNKIDWVVELLEPYTMETKDEKVLHLYLGAGAVQYHQSTGYPKVYTDVVDRYMQLYPGKYKSWIEQEYQLLREGIFKTRFCK